MFDKWIDGPIDWLIDWLIDRLRETGIEQTDETNFFQ